MKEFSELLRIASSYRWRLVGVAFLSLLVSALTLVLPYLAGNLIGAFVGDHSSSANLVFFLLVTVLILLALASAVGNFVSGRVSISLLADLRKHIYEHIQSLPLSFHENSRRGDLLALITQEIGSLSSFLSGTLTSLPSRVLTMVGAMIVIYTISPSLSMWIPLLLGLFFFALRLIGRRLRVLSAAIQEAEANVIATAEENLALLPLIKSFAQEDRENTRLGKEIDEVTKTAFRHLRIQAVLEPVFSLVSALLAIGVLWMAGASLNSGELTPAQTFTYILYIVLLTRPIGALSQLYGEVQSARGTLGRLRRVLEAPGEPGYRASGSLRAVKGRIEFSGVSFGYPDRGMLFEGFDLSIDAGEKLALTGANGAGKTTLVHLLMRHQELIAGQIFIDGTDITTINVRELRRAIGLVSQRNLVFNRSIRDNIAYGIEKASDPQIAKAADLAGITDFIVGLPQGFDTQIGDQGVRLSGGQAQRLALARALIKDPQILLFDEATAMFDVEGEDAFAAVCTQGLAGRTAIIISHRESTLLMADRIVSIEKGTISERPRTLYQATGHIQ